MFKPMALTVVFALLGSLILSLTYLPAAMTFILRGHVSEKESFFIRYAKKWYRPAFNWVLGWHRAAELAAAPLVLVSGILFPFLGSEFIPRLEEGSLAVQVQQLPSVSLSQSVRTVTEVEKVLMTFPEVTKVISKMARAKVATDPMSVDFSDLYIELKPPSEWTTTHSKTELVEKMSEALEKRVPNGCFSFSQPIELRVAELISGVRSDIAIKLSGDDPDTLKQIAGRTGAVVSKVPGAADAKVEATSGLPQLQIKPDLAAIARYGINVEDGNSLIESIVGGIFALALRGMLFLISAGVGFIALFGVAVLNGVVMVSYINHLREEGRSIAEAVHEGAETRLRRVLMTALVASLGFIPMALATSGALKY